MAECVSVTITSCDLTICECGLPYDSESDQVGEVETEGQRPSMGQSN